MSPTHVPWGMGRAQPMYWLWDHFMWEEKPPTFTAQQIYNGRDQPCRETHIQ